MAAYNRVQLRISGRMALFSDPITRVGGEKRTYPIPTYQALKGMLESVYWKPTLLWRVDEVRVMNPIHTQSRSIRPIDYSGGNTLSIYDYLKDVAYEVKAHFEWNPRRPDLAGDRHAAKHLAIAQRMIQKGGRRDVFLGTRECQAYVEPCDYGVEPGAYDDLDEMAFGLMLHGIDYPDENEEEAMRVRFWRPKMVRGVVTFCTPEECPVIRPVRQGGVKVFTPGFNFAYCDDLMQEEGL